MAATARGSDPVRIGTPVPAVIKEPANPMLRAVGTLLARVVQLLTRRSWSELHRVPASGGIVVVANHISNADPLALSHFLVYAGRWPHFLAKDSLFRAPVIGPVLRRCGQIPVRRGTRSAAGSLVAAEQAVREGRCVVVYPEGTISRDPELWPMRGKTGAARIALATGAPVIPVGQWGAQEIWYGRRLGPPHLFPRKTMIVIAGEPVDLDDLRDRPLDHAVLAEATERIMTVLTDLVAGLRRESPPALRFDADGSRS